MAKLLYGCIVILQYRYYTDFNLSFQVKSHCLFSNYWSEGKPQDAYSMTNTNEQASSEYIEVKQYNNTAIQPSNHQTIQQYNHLTIQQ